MTTQINIVDGPSKFDLMTALFVWKPERLRVEFKADDGAIYKASINACEAEDGSGECWIIRGYAIDASSVRSRSAESYEGFFRTNTRAGFLRFIS